jgi:hypothetical protein
MATDDQLVNYLVGDDDGGELDPSERQELDSITSLLADPTLWDDPPASLGANVVSAIAAERDAGAVAGAPSPPATLPPPLPSAVGSAAPTPAEPAGGGTVSPISSAPSRRRRWITPFLAGAAVAAALTAAVVLVATRDDSSNTAEGTEFSLAATDLAPGVEGHAIISQNDSGFRIELYAPDLPRLTGNEFYEGWLRSADGKTLMPIGTFHSAAEEVILWSAVSPEQFPTLTVTRESFAGPTDPAQASSGQVVLKADVSDFTST